MGSYTDEEIRFLLEQLREMEILIDAAHRRAGTQETLELHERMQEIRKRIRFEDP